MFVMMEVLIVARHWRANQSKLTVTYSFLFGNSTFPLHRGNWLASPYTSMPRRSRHGRFHVR